MLVYFRDNGVFLFEWCGFNAEVVSSIVAEFGMSSHSTHDSNFPAIITLTGEQDVVLKVNIIHRHCCA